MTPEARAAAHIALAQHSPYIYPPTIPEGMTCAEWKRTHPRKRTRRQRLVRRLNGLG